MPAIKLGSSTTNSAAYLPPALSSTVAPHSFECATGYVEVIPAEQTRSFLNTGTCTVIPEEVRSMWLVAGSRNVSERQRSQGDAKCIARNSSNSDTGTEGLEPANKLLGRSSTFFKYVTHSSSQLSANAREFGSLCFVKALGSTRTPRSDASSLPRSSS